MSVTSARLDGEGRASMPVRRQFARIPLPAPSKCAARRPPPAVGASDQAIERWRDARILRRSAPWAVRSRDDSVFSHKTDIFKGMAAMDMVERRIREVFATLLSKGAKLLERTAGELEQAASELRQDTDREDVERVWAEESRREPDTMIRSAPLRAVPDTPTDEPADEVAPVVTPAGAPWAAPVDPPDMPERERAGDATVTRSTTVAGRAEENATAARVRQIAAGTVSQVRAQLGDLSVDELRQLKEVELADRRRTTLIAAIDRALADAR